MSWNGHTYGFPCLYRVDYGISLMYSCILWIIARLHRGLIWSGWLPARLEMNETFPGFDPLGAPWSNSLMNEWIPVLTNRDSATNESLQNAAKKNQEKNMLLHVNDVTWSNFCLHFRPLRPLEATMNEVSTSLPTSHQQPHVQGYMFQVSKFIIWQSFGNSFWSIKLLVTVGLSCENSKRTE